MSWWPLRACFLATLLAAMVGCGEREERISPIVTEPPISAGSVTPIIHTLDGRHLRFTAGSFEPSHIEHCRPDGLRHMTSIYELLRISPMGRGESMCPEYSGQVLRLYLVLAHGPAVKTSTHCEDGCVVPGGYYPPLGTVIRIPWSEISYIEFQRD